MSCSPLDPLTKAEPAKVAIGTEIVKSVETPVQMREHALFNELAAAGPSAITTTLPEPEDSDVVEWRGPDGTVSIFHYCTNHRTGRRS